MALTGYALVSPRFSPSAIRLRYSTIWRGQPHSCDYNVVLTSTPCQFGGKRYWFRCPLAPDGQPCNRRCRFLYPPDGARYFSCRRCYDLTYRSQQRSGGRFYEEIERPYRVLQRLERRMSRVRSRRENKFPLPSRLSMEVPTSRQTH